MRCELCCNIGLREGGCGTQDQFNVAHRFSDVRRHQRQLRVVLTARILQQDFRAGRTLRRNHFGVAPPEPDVVALKRKITRGGERAVAAAQHCNLQSESPRAESEASSCLNMKCWTFPKAVRGRSSTKTTSRGTLKRASCDCTCAFRSFPSSRLPERLIT